MFFLGMKPLIFTTLILAWCQHVLADRRPSKSVVTTKYGELRGTIVTFPNRRLQAVEVFLGIPYASAPVGSLRFMPPVTPSHWKGVRNADQFGSVCPQRLPDIANETEALRRMPWGRLQYLRRLLPYLVNQSEDCLHLNIYTPASDRETAKRPVMVYIHGESYEWNSGNPYDGSVLASFSSVVVVTINYRLGIFGFLPTVDGTTRGNYGLLDQVAALHWIQENIINFGGDPENVTIFGHGHGAACVNLLMISPMVKGLFQKAIMQSGSALSPWAIARQAIYHTSKLASTLNCPMVDNAALVECMRQHTVEDILAVSITTSDYLSAFGPTIDGILVPKEPEELMSNDNTIFQQYSLMFGVTRIESFFLFTAEEERSGLDVDRRNTLLQSLVKNLFIYHLQEIFLTIVNEYTDWNRPPHHAFSVLEGTSKALGDALITAPLIKAGNIHSALNSRTYFYVFTYQTENGDYSQRLGAIHGEELPYVFGVPIVGTLSHFKANYTRSEVLLAETTMLHWTNFAKTGDPNPSDMESELAIDRSNKRRVERFLWHEYEIINQRYLELGMKLKIRDHYHAHRLSFWLHLIPGLHRPGEGSVPPHHHHLAETEVVDSSTIITETTTSTGSSLTDSTLETSTVGLNFTQLPEISDTTIKMEELTNTSVPMALPSSGYSTALSVTIAVGCSLLILNVLIFSGIYYQRDKKSSLKKRNCMVRCISKDEATSVFHIKQYPLKAPPPSPAGTVQPSDNMFSNRQQIPDMCKVPTTVHLPPMQHTK
ncbi:neuroligin-4, X-linked-like [Centruroides vittatus]|uniref:neuroligin-4, X-linked-like n=1 Tax=Centruroides vittatus TaxID=120091 RepID=UPI00350FD338